MAFDYAMWLLLLIIIGAATQCWMWVMWYSIIFFIECGMLYCYIGLGHHPGHLAESSPRDCCHRGMAALANPSNEKKDIIRRLWTFGAWKTLGTTILLTIYWLAPAGYSCDLNGGGLCTNGQVSMAGWNSCTRANFMETATNDCAIDSSRVDMIYHPRGSFPYNDQPFSSSGIYAFCYMDQYWALPTDERIVRAYEIDSNGDITCVESNSGYVSLPSCNGASPASPLECSPPGDPYPDPTYGVLITSGMTGTWRNTTTQLRACPGNMASTEVAMTPSGLMVPLDGNGHAIPSFAGYTSDQYILRPGRPFLICPACLWYWMTQVAGTSSFPYNGWARTDPIRSTCLSGWLEDETEPPAYSNPTSQLCAYCPPRVEAMDRINNIDPGPSWITSLMVGMNYSTEAISAFYWAATIRAFILQGMWFFAFLVITKTHSVPFPGLPCCPSSPPPPLT
jgi:hypothetical protein